MIDCENITAYLNNKLILKNISFMINYKDKIALIGKSGAGKTVLAKHIAAILYPFSGKIKRKKKIKIVYLFQEDTLIDNFTIIENIKIVTPKKKYNDIITMAKYFSIEKELLKYPFEVSYNVRKLADFIRNYLVESDLFILDEPTTGLNDKDSLALINFLKNKETFLIITHKISIIEKVIERVEVIENGKNIFSGIKEKFFKNIL